VGAPRAIVTTPWHRSDLLRGCKTGDVVEPLPSARRWRSLLLGVVLGVPAILAAHWVFTAWVPRRYAALAELATIDPVEGARQLAAFSSWLLFVPVLAATVAGIAGVVIAVRVLRAGRWPLPGATVRRRTEVVAGWCARLPAALLAAVLLACLCVVCSSYVRLVAMFWDGYLDRLAGAPR
jgi:hypothetical protein